MMGRMTAAGTFTWDRATVDAVRRLRADAALSLLSMHGPLIDVEEEMRRKCARSIAEAARSFAVQVDEGDVTMHLLREDDFVRHYRSAWMPNIRRVMLRGGECDGREVEVRDPFEPLRVAVPTDMLRQEGPLGLAPIHKRTYSLAGWIEGRRLWVMASDA